jgi:hypothetical protein
MRWSAREIGERILMAPGPDATLFVSIPRADGSVLELFDRTGRPRPGWPIVVNDSTSCGLLLPVNDGSVRVVCDGTDLPQFENDLSSVRAFAFDQGGQLMAGWPVLLRPTWPTEVGSVVGQELTVLEQQMLTDTPSADRASHDVWVTTIEPSGAIQSGVKVPMFETCCEWAVGPDEVAYGVIRHFGDAPSTPKSSELLAVGLEGVPRGFPVPIDGLASRPAFDAAGRLHVTVVQLDGRTRVLVLDANGRAVVGGSDELEIQATGQCIGIEGSCDAPAAPLVSPDGTTFVSAFLDRTTVVALNPSGHVMAGWPYRSEVAPQATGFCDSDICEWTRLAGPAMGPGNVAYLIQATATRTAGGSIVAVGPDGRVRPGWPVQLQRADAAFWSVIVGTEGTVYALAIEPEPSDASSATVLAIAPDSTVLYATTIVDR